jgi:large subunit ribosomal protein L9
MSTRKVVVKRGTKVILRESTTSLGSVGDVVSVSGGYARNYLIPRGIAMAATPGNMRQFEAEKETLIKKNLVVKGKAEDLAQRLSSVQLNFIRKAGDEDKLFGSVTAKDVSSALAEQGYEVEKRLIMIGEPIKTLGNFKVAIKLHQGVNAEIGVSVNRESEGSGAAAETAPAESEAQAQA